MSDRFVLVLAGGRGERFWPWSRAERPKQLLPLATGGRTLLKATLERALSLTSGDHVMILTAPDLAPLVLSESAGTGALVLSEPVARNTAAAIAAGAAWFGARAHDPAFAVLYADHAIDDARAFASDLTRGFEVAERDQVLVTFGVRPSAPDTSFGYIRRGARLAERLYRVARFTEKPDRESARAWVESGEYDWNAGIFVWRCSTFLDALEASRPALAQPFRALRAETAESFETALAGIFPALESIAVDYAVLEKAPNVVMIEAAFDWDDIGSWGAWARRQARDARGNVLFGDALALDCDRCVVVGEGGTAAAMGLADMVVVHAGGATLSCRLEDSGDVRRVSEAARRTAVR